MALTEGTSNDRSTLSSSQSKPNTDPEQNPNPNPEAPRSPSPGPNTHSPGNASKARVYFGPNPPRKPSGEENKKFHLFRSKCLIKCLCKVSGKNFVRFDDKENIKWVEEDNVNDYDVGEVDDGESECHDDYDDEEESDEEGDESSVDDHEYNDEYVYEEAVVGRKIKVYMEDFDKWDECVIKEYSGSICKHEVKYDDGGYKEWLNFSEERIRWVGGDKVDVEDTDDEEDYDDDDDDDDDDDFVVDDVDFIKSNKKGRDSDNLDNSKDDANDGDFIKDMDSKVVDSRKRSGGKSWSSSCKKGKFGGDVEISVPSVSSLNK